MATDPASSIFTFHQPFQEISITYPAWPEIPIPGHFELPVPLNMEQNSQGYPNHQSGLKWNDLLDLEDPLSGIFFWSPCNGSLDDATTSFQYGLPGEGCSNHAALLENCNGSQNPAFGDNRMASLGFSEIPDIQNYCTGCLTLRQITHKNGMHEKRLELHGSLGVITHAILESEDQRKLFDFQNGSMPPAKDFLVQYFDTCKQEGYSPGQDPKSQFYKILSAGLNDSHHQNNDIRSSPGKTVVSNQGPGRFNKLYSLKEQRVRISEMELSDIKKFIHLPCKTAAEKMHLSETTFKKLCRIKGIKRWPYRKIKSIERRAKKQKIL